MPNAKLRELRLVAQALGSAITSDPKFFRALQEYGRQLLAVDPNKVDSEALADLSIVADRVERFFGNYRATTDSLYLTPAQIEGSEDDLSRLRSIIAELEPLEPSVLTAMAGTQSSPPAHPPVAKATTSTTPRVFLVHGHDHGTRDAVARTLTKLGVEVVILSEQANEGRTIIEKFEAHLDVSFAVVLMTPDDRGAPAEILNTLPLPTTVQDLGAFLAPRARQNVILELGYFVGLLGRSKVAALVAGEVERPSDVDGVLYVPFTKGWELDIARELKAAGLAIHPEGLIS
jgi:predicted nucleotide-binding protein